MIRAVLLAAALVSILASAAASQVDTLPPRRDTTAAADTIQPDTTKRDTTGALLPTFAAAIAPGPLPKGARYTFTADSVLLSSSRTLSDLLQHIPGVYIARGGWYGQPEIVLYGGRGPAGIEFFWDGEPMLPLGRDSLYVDPARIPLAQIERVDVIIMPARLEVYLVTARARSTIPRTQVGILTGNQDIADYRAGYAARTRSGFGVALLADWNSIGIGTLGNTTTSFGSSDLWLKADYVPASGRLGASFQIASSSWHRSPASDGRVQGWRQDRRGRELRAFIAQRGDGLGWRLTGTLANTAISRDTLIAPRSATTASLGAIQTWRHATLAATGRLGSGGAPRQLEARAGWMPLAPLTLAGAIRQSWYWAGGSGWRGYVTAGLTLPLGFSVRGEAMRQSDLQSALIRTDSIQEATDVAAWVRFDHPRLSLEVGRGRRDPFTPLGFARGLVTIDSLHPTPLTEFVAGHATVRLVPGLQLAGWYFRPLIGGGDFEPPHHARLSLTFYSKFWRVFKSGIFALRGEVAIESWSRWAFAGIDPGGTPRTMNGASFVDTNLEMQLAGVTIFWAIQNANLMRGSYVPGLGYPKTAQSYGAKWFFNN